MLYYLAFVEMAHLTQEKKILEHGKGAGWRSYQYWELPREHKYYVPHCSVHRKIRGLCTKGLMVRKEVPDCQSNVYRVVGNPYIIGELEGHTKTFIELQQLKHKPKQKTNQGTLL